MRVNKAKRYYMKWCRYQYRIFCLTLNTSYHDGFHNSTTKALYANTTKHQKRSIYTPKWLDI